jgi:hypothetical protein
MTSKRLYYVLLASICLIIVSFIGGAYGASTLLQKQSQTLVSARSKSASLEQQQTQLNKAKASINKYQEVGSIAKSIVPQDKDQAQAVREIVNIAADNQIKLGTITFPSSTLGTGTTPTSAATSKLSQLKPAVGITGVYTLQITVQSDSARPTSYDKFVQFMSALERNRRTALVSSLILQPDAKDPSLVSFTVTIDEYIKP